MGGNLSGRSSYYNNIERMRSENSEENKLDKIIKNQKIIMKEIKIILKRQDIIHDSVNGVYDATRDLSCN